MHVLEPVIDLAVRVHLQRPVARHVLAQELGIARELRHRRELRRGDPRRPALRAEQPNVARVVEHFAGAALPLHEIDEMRRDVDQPFSLLRDVEEPRGALDRRARDELRETVDAFLDDGGLVFLSGLVAPD